MMYLTIYLAILALPEIVEDSAVSGQSSPLLS
jgi:hypothetical protein